jgi:hypothetical protein
MDAIIAAIIIATSNIVLFIMQARLSRKVAGIHHEMNSMKDALVAAAHAEGTAMGVLEERSRADAEKKA